MEKEKGERLLNDTGEIPGGMFRKIISEFSEVFAIEDSDLTQTGMGECKVELEKENPIHKIKYPGVDDRVRIRIPAEKLVSQNRVVPKEVPEVEIETKAKRGRRAMQKDVVNQDHIWEKDNFSVENMKFNKGTRRWKENATTKHWSKEIDRFSDVLRIETQFENRHRRAGW
uniref:Uncharacterized protein n=2 Tax=Caenorhabditis japonica TaxID=281687 RepID=A0A8R1IGV6_CAEJA